MSNTEICNKLRELCTKAKFESTHSISLKNAVVIGTNPNGNVIATYIDNSLNSFYDVDDIVVNVILNERDCDLYGKDYDSEFAIFRSEENHTPVYCKGMDYAPESKNGIELFPNALELILNELESSGDEWIAYQTNLRIRSRHYHRWAINAWDGNKRKEDYPELSWEERLEWVAVKAEENWLHWRRPKKHDMEAKTLIEMNELGEEAYNIKVEKQNAMMRELMKD